MTTLEQKRAFDRKRRSTPEGREKRNSASLDWYYRNRDRILAERALANRDMKIRLVSLFGGECQRCGWNEHPAGLEFHHREPSQKVAVISKLGSEADIFEELSKCDLLCANCHAMAECSWDLTNVWPLTDEIQAVSILAPDEETILKALEG